MKPYRVAALILSLFYGQLWSQTADGWISQGRSFLAAHDIADANSCFGQAVLASPTNETANALYAITRLLVLPNQPAGSNFLTRVGLPAAGRNVFNWTAVPPQDANGLLLAPVGVDANEFVSQCRTNIVPVISAAIANLARITDTNFTLGLSSDETPLGGETLDYGDLKLIQAGMYAAEYFSYTLNSQNLDVQLSALRALYTNNALTAGQVLASYPQLFRFANASDLPGACAAFTNGINAYMAASDFIRARPGDVVRLFNYDPAEAKPEADFRLTLQDLKNSFVEGPQYLAVLPGCTVDMPPAFEDGIDFRSLLPKFDGNAIELGSLPDPTFGGVIDGLAGGDVEHFLGNYCTMLPVGSAPELTPDNLVNLSFTTLSGHSYVLESSTNLETWQFLAGFTATAPISPLVEPRPAGLGAQFYRLRDDTGFVVFAGTVVDQNTYQPIAGAQVLSVWDGASAVTDASGNFYLKTTLLSEYTYECELQVSAPGYSSDDFYYENWGNGMNTGLFIYLSPSLSPLPANDNFGSRVALNGANVSVNGDNAGATMEAGEPADDYGISDGKSVWYTWTAPAPGSYSITVFNTDMYAPILAIYTGAQLASLSRVGEAIGYGYYVNLTLSATAGRIYQIEVDDYYGEGSPFTLMIGQ